MSNFSDLITPTGVLTATNTQTVTNKTINLANNTVTGTANITATGGASGPIAATTLSASSTVSGTGFSTYLASPPAIGGTAPADGTFTSLNTGQLAGLRNRIINGAMTIDQRNNGASVTQTTGIIYPVDRLYISGTVTSKFTAQQNAGSVTPPAGFINYLGMTSLSAYTVGASESFQVTYRIEGSDISDLGWGAASAATVTLSFWVRSSLTGTFGGALRNSAVNRSYAFSYTISSANTWEKKSLTIAGDTSGTWLTTNGTGIIAGFSLGTGSTFSGTAGAWAAANYASATGATSVVGTNAATFYITGVQLELGSVATPFEQRPYGMELALCQRYLPVFEANSAISGYMYSTTTGLFGIPFPVTARVAPTGLTSTAGGSLYDATGTGRAITAVTFVASGVSSGFIQAVAGGGGLTAAQGTLYYGNRILFTGCEL